MANKSKLTDDMKSKIEQVAALDGSVEEMAFYCDVSRQTIYNWLEEDKELFDKVERLRAKPILRARQIIAEKMGDSYTNAVDYLKRKRSKEFGDKQDITSGGESIQPLLVKIIGDEQGDANTNGV